MSLLTKAHAHVLTRAPKATSYYPASNDEIELYLDYINGEVAFSQVVASLGRSYSFAVNWFRRVTQWLYLQRTLRIEHQKKTIIWKQPENYSTLKTVVKA